MLRNTTSQFLVSLGVPRDDVQDVELVLTEACANVVRHAVDSSDYTVDVSVSATGCTIVVRDEGPGFDPGAVRTARSHAESGRGLELIDALVDDVRFTHDGGQHVVHVEMSWADVLDDESSADAKS
jgi:serine/threonine-protein kinase RsbW